MLNMKVVDYFGLRRTTGVYGVEIEMEGTRLPTAAAVEPHWRKEHDPSLRGADNAEYVLKTPVSYMGLKKVMEHMKGCLVKRKSIIDNSVTAGVHIHLNFQRNTLLETYTFITLYYCLENLLVGFCGENRVGNHFCLRATDADYVIDVLARAAVNEDLRYVINEDIRYASLNILALKVYGSLEFRAMRSNGDLDLIEKWARMLYEVKRNSRQFANPQEVINEMSIKGGEQFLRDVLGKYAEEFMVGDWEGQLHNGMRLAQDIAFARDWEHIENVNVFAKDPYIRPAPVAARPMRFQRGELEEILAEVRREGNIPYPHVDEEEEGDF